MRKLPFRAEAEWRGSANKTGQTSGFTATLAVESCSAERPAARWLIWGP